MAIHDWSKVTAGTFHHFHQAWITSLSDALNGHVLPEGYYAMAEQVIGGAHPDVVALEEYQPSSGRSDVKEPSDAADAALALAIHPPRVRYTLEAEEMLYAMKANQIAIYHSSGDRVVALVEIISSGNKRSQVAVNHVLEKLTAALAHGRHLLVIDLHRAGKHDPDGLHAAFWGTTPGVSKEQPCSLAAYRADVPPTAYFEPIAIGAVLPDMPLFLTRDHYVNAPLEMTYQAAWHSVPKRWKRVIEEQQ